MDKTNLMVEFSIIGEDFNPEKITKMLMVEPTEYYMKGSKNERNFEMKESCWSISTGYVETLYVSELFDELLHKLTNKKEKIVKLKKEYNLTCKFFIVINIEENIKPAIYLDKEIVEFANFLEAEFDFDMYIY
ncbi:DUF4279 domain-containing protein [Candidatus Galacturonibacter soehngenii]|uniref:DUF4279 domain-containing protein n=1 Tax=Candidatus Galacturonatibacter soehngenii TaxID=2307010 RepID=A0A7V7UBF7_9FIRM|nr:DUF4279 domain-containing protein [Candidatus Galacturonibacter soehngenii]KAB1438063.1 DUF4279 domain-containing protein [Candidatus Galacturonibacter soehngenii]